MNHNCQIFTPKEIVDEMLDLIDYDENILEKYVLDNSCGKGNFLIEVVKRYINAALEAEKTKEEIAKELSTYIVGVEIDHNLAEECKDNLTQVAKSKGIINNNWNIKCDDGLKYDFKIKFDYIVGNPPYIAYAVLNEEQRKFVKYTFKSCFYGKFDYSYAFIEKCLDLLVDNGKMVFITPSNMYKTFFGKELRKLMLPYITEIVDYSYEKIFKNVLTSPAITVFKKERTSELTYKLKKERRKIVKKISKDELADRWYFLSNESQGKRRFGEYFKVSNSVATLCNNVFVINEEVIKRYNIEMDAVRDAISPKSKKFNRLEFIIFPYYYDENNKLIHFTENEYREKYPNTYKYLAENKKVLESTNKDSHAEWFEFGRSQALSHLNQSKLLISTIITNEITIYELGKEQIPYSGLYIIPIRDIGLDSAKNILQRESTLSCLRTSGIVLNGSSLRISTKDIENIRF